MGYPIYPINILLLITSNMSNQFRLRSAMAIPSPHLQLRHADTEELRTSLGDDGGGKPCRGAEAEGEDVKSGKDTHITYLS